MHLPPLPASSLPQFLHFHPIKLNGIVPQHLGGAPVDLGIALVSTSATSDPACPLLHVDQSLILTPASIEAISKSDRQLHDALAAAGPLARTPRGACIVFLLLRMTSAAGALPGSGQDAWSTYVRYLPTAVPLPTTWTPSERALLTGTSLESAVSAKRRALSAEFAAFRAATEELPWACRAWWDDEMLTEDDWVHADSLFRSRCVELPDGAGTAMVPVLDLANHGDAAANAFFSVSDDGGVELWARSELAAGDEVTIDYSAASKSAAEFVFSYGFLPAVMDSAQRVVLQLDDDSDPLARAKAAVWRAARSVTLYEDRWEGPWVYLAVTNEEDGLIFRVLQSNDGERRLVLTFRGEELDLVEHPQRLEELLRAGDMWEVFQLRAAMTVAARVDAALARIRNAKVAMEEDEEQQQAEAGRMQQRGVGARLRDMEEALLMRVGEVLRVQQETLMAHPTVQAYLQQSQDEDQELQEPHHQPQALDEDAEVDLS